MDVVKVNRLSAVVALENLHMFFKVVLTGVDKRQGLLVHLSFSGKQK